MATTRRGIKARGLPRGLRSGPSELTAGFRSSVPVFGYERLRGDSILGTAKDWV